VQHADNALGVRVRLTIIIPELLPIPFSDHFDIPLSTSDEESVSVSDPEPEHLRHWIALCHRNALTNVIDVTNSDAVTVADHEWVRNPECIWHCKSVAHAYTLAVAVGVPVSKH
jgi:hypothetical protein